MKVTKLNKKLSKLLAFIFQNYIISLFVAGVLFVGFVAAFKYVTAKDEFMYAKVKVSQGLWWANTAKPSYWLVQSIHKGDTETSLTGKPVAEILSVRYYPWWGSDQYDVYVTLKLKVSKNKRTGLYAFKRSTLGVASPIDLEFPSVQISGTVIELNSEPILDTYIEKTVTLEKNFAFPWEFDAINKGDTYADGEDVVFEVLDKSEVNTSVLSRDSGSNVTGNMERRSAITVVAKVKLMERGSELIFGGDQVIRKGKKLNVATPNLLFEDYVVAQIK